MKATIHDLSGNKKGIIELPEIFESKIREDIVAKYYEVDKKMQPYSNDPRAGRKHSASGTISHKRHDWKGHYGKGISRIPRKTMWRRGTQFYWIGAEVSSTRGGRRVHGPVRDKREKKINKKEIQIAMNSAFASTMNKEKILSRYTTIKKIDAPYIVEGFPQKTKEFFGLLNKIFVNEKEIVFKNKKVRAGKGNRRNRKYKSNAGLLFVTGNEENAKFKGIDVKRINEIKIADLYPLGRLTLYTKKAIESFEKLCKPSKLSKKNFEGKTNHTKSSIEELGGKK